MIFDPKDGNTMNRKTATCRLSNSGIQWTVRRQRAVFPIPVLNPGKFVKCILLKNYYPNLIFVLEIIFQQR